ncbi:MAG TPA: hypothetical protein VGV92_05855 [Gammaproteobacteria bacterium]|nr:hypothetical protein [Gammaproteobacteria bacterium]
MQSKKTITIDKALETFLLLEFVRQGDRDYQEGRCIPLEQAFAEVHEEIERMKVLYADIFNNNQTRGEERSN